MVRTYSDLEWLVPTPRVAIGTCTIAAHDNVRRQLELVKSAIDMGAIRYPDAHYHRLWKVGQRLLLPR